MYFSMRASHPPKPLNPGHSCLCLELRRAARILTQHYDAELRLSGLSVAQFGMLARLARMGNSIQMDLAEQLTLDPTTLARTISPLIKKGLVRKVHDRFDRRARRLEVTAAGMAQFRAASAYWKRAQDKVRLRLGEQNWTALQELLRSLIRYTSDS